MCRIYLMSRIRETAFGESQLENFSSHQRLYLILYSQELAEIKRLCRSAIL